MRRRSLFTFSIINIVVTFIVAFLTLSFWSTIAPTPTPKYISQPVIVTATFDTKATQVANVSTSTPIIIIVTATPGNNNPQTINGTDAAAETVNGAVQTLDPALLPTGLP